MIRVLIVSENLLISNILAAVLEDSPDIRVSGLATSASEVLALAPETDVILINNQVTEHETLDLIKKIVGAKVTAKIIVLGLTASKSQVIQYVQAGANGYVLKDASVKELLTSIRDINVGRVDISPKIALALMYRLYEYSQKLHRLQSQPTDIADLTTREKEILELVGQGLTNQQIASHLVIEVGTVKNHVHNILQKMEVSTRREAAATWGIQNDGASDPSLF